MQIPGAQQLLAWGKKQVSLKILFEVVDDPQDSSEFRDCLKPLNVWFLFTKQSVKSQLAPDAFYKAKNVTFVPNITKETPRDVREFGWTTFEIDENGVCLCVLAEPTREWASLYGQRQYELQVFTGRTYNIAVSIPLLSSAATSPTANANQPNTSETVSGKEPKLKLNL
jgi:hypothetical protein